MVANYCGELIHEVGEVRVARPDCCLERLVGRPMTRKAHVRINAAEDAFRSPVHERVRNGSLFGIDPGKPSRGDDTLERPADLTLCDFTN